jgi:dTDP-4-amino-4,6-dideoxygalactose transaminase
MVLAKSEEDAARIKSLALHGLTHDAWRRFGDGGYKHYFVTSAGFKYNMMDLQAAIGLHQFRRVEANHAKRQAIWNKYMAALANLPIELPPPPEPGDKHAYHLFTIQINPAAGLSRDAFLDAMTEHRLGVGVHYLSLPEHPFYQQRFGWRPENFPNAMRFGRRTVSLPLTPKMTAADVNDVVSAVRGILAEHSVRSAVA